MTIFRRKDIQVCSYHSSFFACFHIALGSKIFPLRYPYLTIIPSGHLYTFIVYRLEDVMEVLPELGCAAAKYILDSPNPPLMFQHIALYPGYPGILAGTCQRNN